MSPHEVLGLEPDASQAAVKKAYKAMAQEHHPDKGGDPEEFVRVKQAYDDIMNNETEANRRLRELFQSMLDASGPLPSNIVDSLRMSVNKSIEIGISEIERYEKQKKRILDIHTRVSSPHELLADIVNANISDLDSKVRRSRENVAVNRQVMVMLDPYSDNSPGFGKSTWKTEAC